MANFEQDFPETGTRIEMTVEKQTYSFCIFAYLRKGLILAVAWVKAIVVALCDGYI